MELVRLENITKTYYLGEVDVPVLKGITLSIQSGEMVALMGASGSGKTTLMNILGCLDRPTSGKFWFDGEEMSTLTPNQRALVRTAKLGFVFQSFNLLPRTTAWQNVIMPLDYSPTRTPGAAAQEWSFTLLERVGLGDRADHEPSQMSGGQQQRVAIARSLVNRPRLLLADEPTGNLDSHTSVDILRMFQQLNADGITVILVTHDPKVASYAHRTVRIADGLIEGDETRTPQIIAVNGVHPVPHGHIILNGDSPVSSSPGATRGPIQSFDSDGNGDFHADGKGNAATSAVRATAAATSAAAGSPHLALSTAGGTGVSSVLEAAHVQAAPSTNAAPAGLLHGRALPHSSGFALASMFPATFRTAMGALRRNKMRSFLTALGVIIGVGAVVAITEIGQGSKIMVQKTIASMGADNILVLPGAAASGGISFGVGTIITLTPQDSVEIARQCPAISAAAPIVRARPQVVYGNKNWIPNTTMGTTPAFLEVRDWQNLSEGDVFTDLDVRNWNRVCLIGETLKKQLFEGESPIGKEIRLNSVSFKVIGVLSPKGANMMGMDQDDIVIAPWTTIKYRVSATGVTTSSQSSTSASTVNTLNNLYPAATALYPTPAATQAADTPQPIRFTTVDQIYAKAASTDQISPAIDQITDLLRERHHIHPDKDDKYNDDFNIRDMAEMTKTMSSASDLMAITLLVVAAVSLLVGGVGIMNIMLVSVTERTREIGLRMAVGARSHHILRQFLVEAVVLCLIGGAMGIGFGRLLSTFVRQFMHWPIQTSLLAIVAAVGVSATVGIVFGFYPAWKASRLDPIEALRYE